MPVLGLTTLQAVNRLLRAINTPPVSALDGAGVNGSSIHARAQEVLEDTKVTVLMRGYAENTVKETLTPVSNAITVPANTLRIMSYGADDYRTFDLQGDSLFDVDRNTTNFGTTPVSVRRIFTKAFEDCSPALKELITNEAAAIFQNRQRGNPEQDQALQTERAKVEVVAPKPRTPMADVRVNPVPIIAPQGGQGAQA